MKKLTSFFTFSILKSGLLGFLAVICFTENAYATSHSKVRRTQMMIGQIKSTLEQYQSDCHNYPKGVDGLKSLLEPPAPGVCSDWGPEPYIKCNTSLLLKVRDWWTKLFDSNHQSRCLVDAWENEIHYQSNAFLRRRWQARWRRICHGHFLSRYRKKRGLKGIEF